jgi:hypothetical protein
MDPSGTKRQGSVTEPGGLPIRRSTLAWILIHVHGSTWAELLCGTSSTSQAWTGRPSCIYACNALMRGEISGLSPSTPTCRRHPEAFSNFTPSSARLRNTYVQPSIRVRSTRLGQTGAAVARVVRSVTHPERDVEDAQRGDLDRDSGSFNQVLQRGPEDAVILS